MEINFNAAYIPTVTSSTIDKDILTEKSAPSLAMEITQLLIDIQNSDATELADWVRKNGGTIVPPEKIDPRLRRFTNAFEQIFPTKKYKSIENFQNYKRILFEENGKEMPIGKLSSGEKQIVFRG